LALAGRTTVAAGSVAPSTVLLEDAINQTARLEFVEVFHGGPEHFTTQVFDVLLVDVVLLDKFQDQVPLLVTAMPAIAIGVPVGPVTIRSVRSGRD
jgi:hypothetical protein